MSMFNSPKSSIWGKVQEASEIGENVFSVSTAGHGGIMIPEHVAVEILSPQAIEMGVNEGGFIQYEEDSLKDIPLYELIKANYITDKRVVDSFSLEDTEKDGKLMLPQYFGEYNPPQTTIWGGTDAFFQISNGVGAAVSGNAVGLSVHKSVAYFYLSEQMEKTGIENGDYLFYEKEDANTVVQELKMFGIDNSPACDQAYELLGIYSIQIAPSMTEERNDNEEGQEL